jgi:glycerol-1-phosphate dehydrogenase [NAD(P)+]
MRTPVLFPATVHADYDRVLELQAALSPEDVVPVAVGSGTLNDLTKLAAYRLGRPYVVVATAASMDGYAAFGASITRDGFKQTMACAAPAAIVADVDLLASAPVQLTSSGYGDLLGRRGLAPRGRPGGRAGRPVGLDARAGSSPGRARRT